MIQFLSGLPSVIKQAGIPLMLATLISSSAAAADPSQFTEAERQLFVTPHLDGLTAPTRLHYAIARRGSLQDTFDDHAELALVLKDGKPFAQVQYLTGQKALKLPPFPDVQSNPVLLYFLEREIRELKRLTGGSINYFRKRIRMALATKPTVEKIQVPYQGRKLDATRVTIDPYVDDPARERYEKFARRRYQMTISPDIPGGIVSLSAELHTNQQPQDNSTLLWSETVRFERHN